MTFTVPALPYDYNALEPSISEGIMRLHHDKHHQAYVDKLNKALESTEANSSSLETLLRTLDEFPESVRTTIRNNAGGHYNHSLFWQVLSPQGGGEPGGELARAIVGKYGSFQAFIDEFSASATNVFGSGWVWLQPDMSIVTTQNQDNPLMSGGEEPILGLDVWEHAYYLDYQNRRPEYIKEWWNVIDWSFVQSRFYPHEY